MFVICYSLVTLERVIFARYLVCMPILYFVKRVFTPLIVLSTLSYLGAYLVAMSFAPSFLRVCLTTAFSLGVMGVMGWSIALDVEERNYVLAAFAKVKHRLLG